MQRKRKISDRSTNLGESTTNTMTESLNRHNWYQRLDPLQQDALGRTWHAVGVPGYVGPKKRQRRAAMDERFGANGWRIGHYVRGRIVSELRGDGLLQIRGVKSPGYCLSPAVVPIHDPALLAMHPLMTRKWWLHEGCQHLSVEAFWQTSKVLEVRCDRWLALGAARRAVLAEINGRE